MHHIIYMSRMTRDMDPVELVTLVVQARKKNAGADITGALVYGRGQFMQVLEGNQPAVTALYERIIGDARHRAVVKLADKPITERAFVNWSMASRELSAEQAAELEGYVSPDQWEQMHFTDNSSDARLLQRMREIVLTRG